MKELKYLEERGENEKILWWILCKCDGRAWRTGWVWLGYRKLSFACSIVIKLFAAENVRNLLTGCGTISFTRRTLLQININIYRIVFEIRVEYKISLHARYSFYSFWKKFLKNDLVKPMNYDYSLHCIDVDNFQPLKCYKTFNRKGTILLLVAFAKLRKGTMSVVMSVCPSVRPSVLPSVRPSICQSVRPSVRPPVRPSVRPSIRMNQLGSHWSNFH